MSVRDNGEGIPKEFLTRIFEKFSQAEAKRRNHRVGSGLGLTFCKLAVEAHGGKIWVESEPGQGSEFFFTLPLPVPTDPESTPQRSDPEPTVVALIKSTPFSNLCIIRHFPWPIMKPLSTLDLDRLCVNTLRFLAVDAVEKANSGHPGTPMEAAGLGYVLWTRVLRHNPKDPQWANRDRFVLSCGHASMLLYGLLHLTGYDLHARRFQTIPPMGFAHPRPPRGRPHRRRGNHHGPPGARVSPPGWAWPSRRGIWPPGSTAPISRSSTTMCGLSFPTET
jgi:hypothetical protein